MKGTPHWCLLHKTKKTGSSMSLTSIGRGAHHESSARLLRLLFSSAVITKNSGSKTRNPTIFNIICWLAQCMKWQHFFHKCHCFIGYCHMVTIKHYNTLIYFPDQNFNFSNPSLCNFDLRWQILIWLYLTDNHFTEITVPLPYTL